MNGMRVESRNKIRHNTAPSEATESLCEHSLTSRKEDGHKKRQNMRRHAWHDITQARGFEHVRHGANCPGRK